MGWMPCKTSMVGSKSRGMNGFVRWTHFINGWQEWKPFRQPIFLFRITLLIKVHHCQVEKVADLYLTLMKQNVSEQYFQQLNIVQTQSKVAKKS